MAPFFPLILKRDYAAVEELIAGPISVSPGQIGEVGTAELAPKEFLHRISKCNLQELYRKDDEEGVIAIWMCPLVENERPGFLSKTILARVELSASAAKLSEYFERYDARPAPESRFRNAPVK